MTEFRPSRFEILPTIIKNLLIINALVFFAQYVFSGPSAPVNLEEMLALHAWQSPLFRPWQLLTHMFLHGGFYHLFGNMFALWMFGAVLENLWGSKRFLIFYLVCGLGAALIHLLFLSYEFVPLLKEYENLVRLHSRGGSAFNMALVEFVQKYEIRFDNHSELIETLASSPDNGLGNQVFRLLTNYYNNTINTATLGASGAVFGVLAAFVYLFPNTYIYIYFLFPIKAKWIGLIYFSYELFVALQNSAGDNVARWAHVGGALVGLLIVITWNKTNKKSFY